MGKVWEMEPIPGGRLSQGRGSTHSYNAFFVGLLQGLLILWHFLPALCGQRGLLRLWTETLRQKQADVGSGQWV